MATHSDTGTQDAGTDRLLSIFVSYSRSDLKFAAKGWSPRWSSAGSNV
jgi:hypothetical protein